MQSKKKLDGLLSLCPPSNQLKISENNITTNCSTKMCDVLILYPYALYKQLPVVQRKCSRVSELNKSGWRM